MMNAASSNVEDKSMFTTTFCQKIVTFFSTGNFEEI